MKRVIKIVLLSILALVVIIAAALCIALTVLNPNDFKPIISQKVEEATGRELVFEGDIKAVFFPWLGLKTGKMRLNDAEGFSAGPFLEVESISFKLEVLPLLGGSINIDEIKLSGLNLKLEEDAKGRKNWEMISKSDGEAPHGESVPGREKTPEAGGVPPMKFSVKNVSVDKSSIVYRHFKDGASYRLGIDSLEIEGFDSGVDSEAKLLAKLTAQNVVSGVAATVGMEGSLNLGPDFSVNFLKIEPLDLVLSVKDQKELATASLVAEYSMKTQKAEIRDLSGKFAGTSFKGALTALLPGAKDLAEGLTLDARGTLAVETVDVTIIQAALASLTAKGGQNGKNADRGAAPAEPRIQPGKGSPYAALGGVYAECLVTVKEVRSPGVVVTAVTLPVKAHKGQISLDPYAFKVFDGSVTGKAIVDLRGKTPAITATNAVRGLQLSNLINKGAGKIFVKGTLESNLDIKGEGSDWQSIAPTLSGRGDFKVINGEVKNFVIIPGGIIPGFEGKLPTDFSLDRVSGTAVITKGIVNNSDFVMLSPLLSANGRGTANIVQSQLDYELDINVPGLPIIPATVSGPFDKFSYKVDMKKLLEGVAKSQLMDGISDYLPGKSSGSDKGDSSTQKKLKNMGRDLGKIFK